MHLALLVVAAVSALLAIACEERAGGRHPAFYVLKPLTTLLILGAAWLAPDADPAYRLWTCGSLLLSMLGDIALMFEGEKPFLMGLGSFLLAHAGFVAGLVGAAGWQWPSLQALWLALPALAFFAWLLPRTGALKLPVCVYGAALMALWCAAVVRAELRQDLSGALAVAGAGLFLLSDSALSIRQFIGPYVRAQTVILVTYWAAIGLLTLSLSHTATLA